MEKQILRLTFDSLSADIGTGNTMWIAGMHQRGRRDDEEEEGNSLTDLDLYYTSMTHSPRSFGTPFINLSAEAKPRP